jgi:hypothetical protein
LQASTRRLYFLPEPSGSFLVAQEQAVAAFAEKIKIQEDLAVTMPELFWFPPASIFNVEAAQHLPDLIANAATFLPLFVERILRSREDPTIRPLKRATWKNILRLDHFKVKTVGVSNWWKAGDVVFFGEKWGKEVSQSQEPDRAKLSCGCSVTSAECNSAVFTNAVVYTLNKLNLLYQLAKICRPQVARELNINETDVELPDLFNPKNYQGIKTYRLIVWTVMGRDVPEPNGYIGPFIGEPRTKRDDVLVWLDFAKNVLPATSILPGSHPAHPLCLEETAKKLASDRDLSIVEWVEKALIERLFAHCFELGDWLPEISSRRPPPWATFCRACRERAQDFLDENDADGTDSGSEAESDTDVEERSSSGTKRKGVSMDEESSSSARVPSGKRLKSLTLNA